MNFDTYYFCRINTNLNQEKVGKQLHIGPAYRKVISVSKSISKNNTNIKIVTCPVYHGKTSHYDKFYEGDVCIVSLFAIGFPIVDRLLSSLGFFFYSLLSIKNNSRVILYNFFPEYILASLLLRLKKVHVYLDIEDAPRVDENNLRGVVNYYSFILLKKICQKKYITVSEFVKNNFATDDSIVVYGVADVVDDEVNLKFNENKVNIIYGGAIIKETGVGIFCDCIEQLNAIELTNAVNIYVTGFGDLSKINNVVASISNNKLKVIVLGEVSYMDYKRIIKSCDVGLCLKMPNTGIGDTTFPSKVVEITSNKLLLVSTPVSDVPQLFDDRSSIILKEATGSSLAEQIQVIASNPSAYKVIAENGYQKCKEIFSESNVGSKIYRFLSK